LSDKVICYMGLVGDVKIRCVFKEKGKFYYGEKHFDFDSRYHFNFCCL